jgi:ribosome-associated translation inhibitor RaiA
MKIQVSTGKNVEGSAELTQHIESVVENSLRRFADRVSRIEVHLTDENGADKGGSDDKRCVIEARLAGLQPMSVTATSATWGQALSESADKIKKLLTRTLDKMNDAKGRTSFAGESS